ncbi:unnamed protein product [Protopolystoma xenopodis]|uniref:Uncharacterized protein n=1 Tax=Protopolystoma xenopodis TaxID=117903 RepID=A0A3S5BL61_9PLAT|nr:unnamed protein product [Protopolystoma xenopodis]
MNGQTSKSVLTTTPGSTSVSGQTFLPVSCLSLSSPGLRRLSGPMLALLDACASPGAGLVGLPSENPSRCAAFNSIGDLIGCRESGGADDSASGPVAWRLGQIGKKNPPNCQDNDTAGGSGRWTGALGRGPLTGGETISATGESQTPLICRDVFRPSADMLPFVCPLPTPLGELNLPAALSALFESASAGAPLTGFVPAFATEPHTSGAIGDPIGSGNSCHAENPVPLQTPVANYFQNASVPACQINTPAFLTLPSPSGAALAFPPADRFNSSAFKQSALQMTFGATASFPSSNLNLPTVWSATDACSEYALSPIATASTAALTTTTTTTPAIGLMNSSSSK